MANSKYGQLAADIIRSVGGKENIQTLVHCVTRLRFTFVDRSKVDDDVLDNLEEVFITSDVGVDTTLKILDRIQKRVAKDKYINTAELNDLLCALVLLFFLPFLLFIPSSHKIMNSNSFL